jgi:hypothetical protein
VVNSTYEDVNAIDAVPYNMPPYRSIEPVPSPDKWIYPASDPAGRTVKAELAVKLSP